MADNPATNPIDQKKVDLPQKLSDLQIDDILSCTKVEATDPTDQAYLNDIELGDLDEKIAEKLNQIKARSMPENPTGENSRWLLRQEPGAPKRRWLVARNIENEMEISVDLMGLEAKD
ncbi:hypothetical protein MJO28_006095 [Puccinia striiformis f. sp. tritici]|uniref:Uncharacterized protein n=3 Tax=Puccinia striiformis TaxID=27350 RepID=A0A0L0V4H3_9BASI|nr:hypothetical protein Pst134EA_011322 [Puccinia striiformis f. sp. tritici]KAI9604928.1 hypothetical protein H4Q26_002898 [Puccinia striiformis f. sp. tritici PST-130]KNE94076.1 hypothetical protein PSTG_12586 [Puccinia striiformis f. sp. tritici PST-78]POW03069.1 hypothetical protein PSHT_11835 [Puccinia striiformis]KAH9456080.1 hypothetical protein Pst134EB_012290 [Puccinia striiformis f. sp. tritici]KAH9467689.1 hypothetical protein Pst134EA_011322 [Puccinia striiformis f. sp. tritici]